jgi:hypothetical protein
MALTEAGLDKGFLQSHRNTKTSNTYKAFQTQLPKSTGGQKRLAIKMIFGNGQVIIV